MVGHRLQDQRQAVGPPDHAQPRLCRQRLDVAVLFGIDNGVPTASLPPRDFAPTSQGDQLQWPKWGQHYETKGEAGEPPDLPEAKRLLGFCCFKDHRA